MFAAMRLASSLLSNLAADCRPGSSSKQTYASCWPSLSRTMKQASLYSSTDHGGGKRRGGKGRPCGVSVGLIYKPDLRLRFTPAFPITSITRGLEAKSLALWGVEKSCQTVTSLGSSTD